jgi:hypothetical protein
MLHRQVDEQRQNVSGVQTSQGLPQSPMCVCSMWRHSTEHYGSRPCTVQHSRAAPTMPPMREKPSPHANVPRKTTYPT